MTTRTTKPNKVVSNTAGAVVVDPAALAQLKKAYGNDAFWLADPQLGPVLLATLTAGRSSKGRPVRLLPNTTEFNQFIATHGVNPAGQVIATTDPSMNWWAKNGSVVAQRLQERSADSAVYKQGVADTLASVQSYARSQGLTLDPTTEQALAEQLYQTGEKSTSVIQSKINALAPYDANAKTGSLAQEQSKFTQTMADYGIPVPKDPTELKAFQDNMKQMVQGSLAPGATDDAFTTYAKDTAKGLYPWMSGAIDAGITPKQYLSPYITTIANTLNVSPASINIQDPKWASLFTKPDPSKPGVSQAANFNDIMKTVKNDPQYRYDYTSEGRTQAADFAAQLKQQFGY